MSDALTQVVVTSFEEQSTAKSKIAMNGKPGDDPVLDIVIHGLRVYSADIDGMVQELSKLMDRTRLQDFVISLRGKPLAEIDLAIRALLREKRDEARSRGWEVN